jgi:hypothetical protein
MAVVNVPTVAANRSSCPFASLATVGAMTEIEAAHTAENCEKPLAQKDFELPEKRD